MAPPERIGKVGTVKITYRKGYSGPTTVTRLSEYDSGRLQELVDAYVQHAQAVDKLNDHPNRRVRNQLLGMLDMPLQGPHLHKESKSFDFPVYVVRGMLKKRAVQQGTIVLEPKHIERIEVTDTVEVTN